MATLQHDSSKGVPRGSQRPAKKGQTDTPEPGVNIEEPAIVEAVEKAAMIREAAYFRAEKRQFRPGHELEDWLGAEHEIRSRQLGDSPIIEKLQRERDELRVRMHLAKLEVRQEWDELEKKWDLITTRTGSALEEAREAGKEVGAAMRLLLGEIRQGYKRIRKSL